MKKDYLIAGNWKMNLNTHEASMLLHHLNQKIRIYRDVEVVLAPNLLSLQPLSLQLDRRKFRLAAQNAYFKDNGPYTGEVSFTMLEGLVHYVIVGHSERRIHFNESLETVRDKVSAALRNDISPILCVGETQQERRAGETKQVLHDQVTTALSNLISEDIERVVIAYEPVWAISTFGGELASPTEVKKAIDFIRMQITELYGATAAKSIRILYGGSVDDHSVRSYLELDGCNGSLVGGASLNVQKFSKIVEVAHAVARERHGKD